MKYELGPQNRDRPDEELLADLKRVAQQLSKRTSDERGIRRAWAMVVVHDAEPISFVEHGAELRRPYRWKAHVNIRARRAGDGC